MSEAGEFTELEDLYQEVAEGRVDHEIADRILCLEAREDTEDGSMSEPRTCSICSKNPAIIKVHLENGADVHWCGPCIQKKAVKKGARR